MKKFFIAFSALVLSASAIMAQAPKQFSYQTVVRNSGGSLVASSNVGVKISILKTTANGASQYSERHTVTTNANGLASLSIGSGTQTTGSLANIDWTNDAYFVKTEIDPAGGTNYTIAGTSQMLAAPYALNGVMNGRLVVGATSSSQDAALVVQGKLYGGVGPGVVEQVFTHPNGTPKYQFSLEGQGANAGFNIGEVNVANGRLFIQDGTGLVGIGTSTPAGKLHVETPSYTRMVLKSTSTEQLPDAAIIFDRSASSPNNTAGIGYSGTDGLNAVVDGIMRLQILNNGNTGFPNGNIGIGTNSPTAKLSVNGSANNTTGSWGTFSDARLKTIDGKFSEGLSTIMKINPVKFHYNEKAPLQSKDQQIGIIAQELEQVAPYMVNKTESGDIKDLRHVNNQAYTFLLINAVKEQQAQIEALKAENAALKSQASTFENKFEILSAKLDALTPVETVKK
jgi:FtsZ-binding cell division protein ZapB